MSKNPAWNAYNEKHREINEAYDQEMKPARAALSQQIAATEKRFDDQIEPLVLEKKSLIDGLKAEFQEKALDLETKRKKALKVAHEVLQTEIRTAKDEKALAGAA